MTGPTRRANTPAVEAPHQSVDLTSPEPATAPELPHERDEGAGMTDGVPSPRVRQGQADLKRGVQDTSGAPEADTAYRKLKKPV